MSALKVYFSSMFSYFVKLFIICTSRNFLKYKWNFEIMIGWLKFKLIWGLYCTHHGWGKNIEWILNQLSRFWNKMLPWKISQSDVLLNLNNHTYIYNTFHLRTLKLYWYENSDIVSDENDFHCMLLAITLVFLYRFY
jgi:hypothetical protein